MLRAVGGARLPYAELPADVRAWVEDSLRSSVLSATTQAGGMSLGWAARLRTATGVRAFLKAVHVSTNEGTVALFRREIDVLSVLPPAPYRAPLVASYDDGEAVALLLTDVEGRFPDLSDPADAAAVWDVVTAQSGELTPPPAGLLEVGSVAASARRQLATWREEIAPEPERYLPPWAVRRLPELLAAIDMLPDRLPSEALCHWDLREDNLLVRPDGSVVVVDWGMARLGPSWADRFVLAVNWASSPRFDEVMTGWPGAQSPELVTDLLVLLGGRLSWLAAQPAPAGLPPTFPALTAAVAETFLTAAQRRLAAA